MFTFSEPKKDTGTINKDTGTENIVLAFRRSADHTAQRKKTRAEKHDNRIKK